MNTLRYLSFMEQREAHRAAFLLFWNAVLLPELIRLGESETTIAICKRDRWIGWLASESRAHQ